MTILGKYQIEHGAEGPLNLGYWELTAANGETKRVSGKGATLISLLFANHEYQLRDDFHPLDLFSEDSLIPGQKAFIEAYAKDHPDQAKEVWEAWYRRHPEDRPENGR